MFGNKVTFELRGVKFMQCGMNLKGELNQILKWNKLYCVTMGINCDVK